MTARRWTVSVDIGDAVNPTGIVVVGVPDGQRPTPQQPARLTHIERVDDAVYDQLAAHVAGIAGRYRDLGPVTVLLGVTGVGRAIAHAVAATVQDSTGLASVATIAIAGLANVTAAAGYTVARSDLIAHARLALQRRVARLGDTPDAAALADELRSYRDRPRRPATDASSEDWWRLRERDDLVLAFAAALWLAHTQATTGPASPADSPMAATSHPHPWFDSRWRARRFSVHTEATDRVDP